MKKKLAKNIGILYKIWKYVDLNVLKQLYYTVVYPGLLKLWYHGLGQCMQNKSDKGIDKTKSMCMVHVLCSQDRKC